MAKEILAFDSVDISYENGEVLHDISFSLMEGEILGLVGESGSGKTTAIKSILGLLNDGVVSKGNINYKGENLLSLSEREMRQIRGAEIGMIFQDSKNSLSPIRTIGSQILESMAAHSKINKSEAKAKALDLFNRLNIHDPEKIWNSHPFELSGGMNQRIGIAMSMLTEPSVLLADEPTSALDVAVQKQVVQELLSLREIFNTAIIIVTHDIGVVSVMADKILVLKDGYSVEYGVAKDVLNNPKHEYTKLLLSCVPRLNKK